MSIKETIPFNFDETYSFIEQKFTERGYDSEQGSNVMQLVTAMSYLTSMLNANTAVNVNETLLPLARKRATALQDARVLGYEIEHKRSYRYNVDLLFVNETPDDQLKNILKYTSFKVGEYTYYYLGEELEFMVPANSSVQKSITITEGKLTKFTDNNQTTLTTVVEAQEDQNGNIIAQRFIDVPFTDVEEDGLEVFLTYYDEFGQFYEQELWTKSKTFMIDKDTILNKEYVRLDDIDYRTPRIYFKLGDVGKEVRLGTIVQINVLQSSGSLGLIPQGTQLEDFQTQLNAQITGYRLELEGSEEESLESVKINAPLFHNTANRAITKPDYIAFCNRLAKVEYTDAWDGHEEFPQRPGVIWFSFVSSKILRQITPSDNSNTLYQMQDTQNYENWYIDQTPETGIDQDIQEIYDELDTYKVPTLKFFHRNPVYFDFNYTINIVKYNAVKSRSQRNADVFEVINNYFRGFDDNGKKVVDTPVETFEYEYFQSNLNKRIDIELTDIMGFNIDLKTSITLNNKNIIRYETVSKVDEFENPTDYFNEIRFNLGYPYENIKDINGEYIFDNFPKISTLIDGKNLYVDKLNGVLTDTFNDITSYNIRLGTGTENLPNESDEIVGVFKIIDNVLKNIEVILYVKTENGHEFGLDRSDIDNEITLDVKYPSPNIKFSRNTIPRLKQINFI